VSTITDTCITCDTTFTCERGEDGYEIPGQKCAAETCGIWICPAGCMEHFSFVCECGGRFCNDCRVEMFGLNLCGGCAVRHWTICGNCDRNPIDKRFPDGTGACADCLLELKNSAKGCPKCPMCAHPYWVSAMDSHREWFRCGCGLKFARGNPFTYAAALQRANEAELAPKPSTGTLFQPAGYSDNKSREAQKRQGEARWNGQTVNRPRRVR
jgi:hypothetical protein